jgi:hypothetical protein
MTFPSKLTWKRVIIPPFGNCCWDLKLFECGIPKMAVELLQTVIRKLIERGIVKQLNQPKK